MASSTQEILAKLGVDSSKVPEDLKEADKFFKKFAKEAEAATGKAGASSGAKFMQAFGKKFSGAGLASALGSALGLNINSIAEKLAEGFQKAFGGGSAKQFGEVEKSADRISELLEKNANDRLSAAQKIAKEEKLIADAIAKQQEIASRSGENTAERQQEFNKAKIQELEAQQRLNDLRKEDARLVSEAEKQLNENARERLSKEQQVKALEADIFALAMERAKVGQTEGERKQKDLAISEKQKQIDELIKEIADEKLKAEEKITKEKERQQKLTDKIADTERKASNLRENITDKTASLRDRSKLTIAELATLPGTERKREVEAAREEQRRREAFSFGVDADLSAGQRAAKEQARKILDLEAEAEQARLSGDVGKAESIFRDVGAMRESLVASGAIKTTEGDPQKEQLKELQKSNAELVALNKEIAALKTARLKNT